MIAAAQPAKAAVNALRANSGVLLLLLKCAPTTVFNRTLSSSARISPDT